MHDCIYYSQHVHIYIFTCAHTNHEPVHMQTLQCQTCTWSLNHFISLSIGMCFSLWKIVQILYLILLYLPLQVPSFIVQTPYSILLCLRFLYTDFTVWQHHDLWVHVWNTLNSISSQGVYYMIITRLFNIMQIYFVIIITLYLGCACFS